MKVTVAICTWNRSRLLRQTLSSFLEMEIPASVTWELIVVDNRSSDDTAEVIRSFSKTLPIKYLYEPMAGHSRSRNRAVAVAEGDLLLWTDDDVIVSRNWLREYAAAARDYPQAAFFGSKIVPRFEGGAPEWIQETWEKCHPAFAARDLGEPTRPFEDGQYPFGANFAVRTLVQQGFLFDIRWGRNATGMLGDDEINVLQRMTAVGHQGVWLANATVEHIIPAERATPEYLSRYFVGQGIANVIKRKPTTVSRGRARWIGLHHDVCYRVKHRRRSADEWVSHLIRGSIARGEFQGWKVVQQNPHLGGGLPRIAVVTDVPFWRRETGAQQRMASMMGFLQKRQFSVTTIFLGPLVADPEFPVSDLVITERPQGVPETTETNVSRDQDLIQQQGWKVISLLDDWSPVGWLDWLRWKLRCLVHANQQWLNKALLAGRGQPASNGASKSPRRLAEFKSVEFAHRFQQWVSRHQPEVVIVEYVTLSYLVKAPPRPPRPQYWIDTHDLLSTRNQQFQQQGHDHWVDVELEEEANCLKKFDTILAIQPHEGARMAQLTNDSATILVVGHAIDPAQRLPTSDVAGACQGDGSGALVSSDRAVGVSGSMVKIGVLASLNAANCQGIKWFLNEVWPQLTSQYSSQVALVVAGGVCDCLRDVPTSSSVQLLGKIPHVSDFYSQVDIVINPTQFGTGLKIKNIEALSVGLPLVATAHAVEGMNLCRETNPSQSSGLPENKQTTAASIFEAKVPLVVAETADEMAAVIAQLVEEPAKRRQLAENGLNFAKNFLSSDFVYRDLVNFLLELNASSNHSAKS